MGMYWVPLALELSLLRPSLLRLLLLLALSPSVFPRLEDGIIDDTSSSVTYYPSLSSWYSTCGGCTLFVPTTSQPDPLRAHNSSFKAYTQYQDRTLSHFDIKFVGVEISVKFILFNGPGDHPREIGLNFFLDGVMARTQFYRSSVVQPNSQQGFLYNVEVYRQSGLPDREHLLRVEPFKQPEKQWVCFDYATYRYEVPDDPPANAPIAITSQNPDPDPTPVSQVSDNVDTTRSQTLSKGTPATSISKNLDTISTQSSSGSDVQYKPTGAFSISELPLRPTEVLLSERTSSTRAITIIGGATGGSISLAIIIVALVCFLRKRRQRKTLQHRLESIELPYEVVRSTQPIRTSISKAQIGTSPMSSSEDVSETTEALRIAVSRVRMMEDELAYLRHLSRRTNDTGIEELSLEQTVGAQPPEYASAVLA